MSPIEQLGTVIEEKLEKKARESKTIDSANNRNQGSMASCPKCFTYYFSS